MISIPAALLLYIFPLRGFRSNNRFADTVTAVWIPGEIPATHGGRTVDGSGVGTNLEVLKTFEVEFGFWNENRRLPNEIKRRR